MRSFGSLAVLAVVVLIIVGCGSSRHHHMATGCTPTGRFLIEGAGFYGAQAGGLFLKNRGDASCSLPAWPQVSLQWNGHNLAGLQTTRSIGYRPDRRMRVIRTLRPGQWAFAPLTWDNWCNPIPWASRPSSLTLRLTLSTGTIDLPQHPAVAGPQCAAPGHSSTFTVGRFYSPPPIGWKP